VEWVNSMDFGNILRPFSTFYGHWVIYIVAIWYICPRFGILCQDKSGNPGGDTNHASIKLNGTISGFGQQAFRSQNFAAARDEFQIYCQ
jgi:hypothetical protein